MQLDRSGYDVDFLDTFAGEKLDLSRWIPAYLPQRSNRARSAARYELRGGRLRLLIEQDQEPWSPEHNGGLRVSNLQTGHSPDRSAAPSASITSPMAFA